MSNNLPVPVFEGLEPRLLLTTLVGGDVFEYQDANEQIIRISLGGDVIAEFIGADIDTSSSATAQELVIGDLPGTFVSSDIGRTGANILGGVGGADGVELIGATAVTEPVGFSADGTNINAIASRDSATGAGQTFGINRGVASYGGADRTFIQLVQFTEAPNATGDPTGATSVEAYLQQATLRDDKAADLTTAGVDVGISSVRDMAVDPTTGLGYALGATGGTVHLYSVDLITGDTNDLGAIRNTTLGVDLQTVEALSFDDTGQMWILTQDYDADPTSDASGLDVNTETPPGKSNLDVALISVDKANGHFVAADIHSVLVGGLETTALYTGMAFDASNNVYAIATTTADDTTTNNLHRIADPTGLGAGANVTAVDQGKVEGAVIVSLTFAEDISGGTVLVGMDYSQTDEDTGATLARLVSVNTNSGAMSALCEPGMVSTIGGITSYAATGKPLLYGITNSTTASDLIRGSVVSLPTDGDGVTTIENTSGASFRPVVGDPEDGLLYFTAADAESVALYTIDVTGESMSDVQNSMSRVGTIAANSGVDVTTLMWEQTPGTPQLWGFETSGPDDTNALIRINAATGGVTQTIAVTLGEDAVTDITAMSIADDDPTKSFGAGDEFILAVSNAGADSNLLQIRNTGGAYVLGPLSDPDHTPEDGPVRGENLQGMTWNSVMRNPFTGEVGVLIGTDAGTDELVYIDSRARFPGIDTFAIYVSQASLEATISIAVVPPLDHDGPRDMLPFEASIGEVRVIPAQGGDLVLISAEDGTGGVYIGARTEDLSSDIEDEDKIPIIAANLGEAMGVRAMNVDDWPADNSNDLSSGVVVAESILNYFSNEADLVDRLLNQNVDDVQGIAVDREGNIVVVDSDGSDEGGTAITGDQVALVDADGHAAVPVTIVDALTSIPLAGIGGLDYGDINFTGTESLYAVMSVNDASPAASIGGDLGADFDTVGLTVTPGGQMYAIDDAGGGVFNLYLIDRDATGVTAMTLVGAIDATLPPAILADMTVGVPALGPYTVAGISALEADSSGSLYAVAAVAFGGTEGTQQTLLRISSANGAGTVVGLLDEGVLAAGDNTKALAFNAGATNPMLYAVVSVGGVDTLYSIDTTPANTMQAATSIGAVEIAAAGLDIEAADFIQTDVLVAIDVSGGAGTHRMVRIDLTNPDTATVQVTLPGTVDDDLRNYAIDSTGLAYSIFDDGAANNEVWVSPGMLPTLGTLDTTTGLFTQIGAISNAKASGAGAITSSSTIAFSPGEGSIAGQQGLYVVVSVDDEDELKFYEIDPTDGSTLAADGDNLRDSDSTTVPVVITSMDFDSDSNLFAQDLSNGRLVDINLRQLGTGEILVGGTVATTVGSLRPTVGAISYDFSTDQFLAVDNATGSVLLSDEDYRNNESAVLMTLKGTDNNVLLDQQMGKILVGGTVTGKVHINGSIDKFYTGWLITGDTAGQAEAAPTITNNFLVDGDIRDLIVKGSIGTLDDSGLDEPVYMSGFDMEVLGRVGQTWTMNSFIGKINVQNLQDIVNFNSGISQSEIEYRTNDTDENVAGRMFQDFHLYDAEATGGAIGTFHNDTFDNAQYAGTIRNAAAGAADEVYISGQLSYFDDENLNDNVDYYALSLLAGQTVTIRLNASNSSNLMLGVFDPDGRLIVNTDSIVDPASTLYQPFQITADRPGAYRLAVAWRGDNDFTGDGTGGTASYGISVSDAGEVALGAVVAARNVGERTGNNIFGSSGYTNQFTVERGDLGAIFAGDKFFSEITVVGDFDTDIYVANGNVRSIEAGEIGRLVDGEFSDGIRVLVPNGDAGLIRATDPDGVLYASRIELGGDMQTIDGAGLVYVNLLADGGLGVLRAASMSTGVASILSVNVDGVGNDGIIDLIDVTGDFGSLDAGGPAITTGPGGNVRYIRVGGTAYQDSFFGGGAVDFTDLQPGQGMDIEDDSGGGLRIAPTANSYDAKTGLPVDPVTFESVDAPTISYRTYGIRGSGGVVLMDVRSTGGVSIRGDSNGLGNAVEVTRIQTSGAGRAVVDSDDPVFGQLKLEDYTDEAYPLDLNVRIRSNGGTPVDLFEVIGGNFTTIANYTGGEIVNVIADTIGTLKSYGNIGLASHNTGAAVNPINVIAGGDSLPFVQQHVGIVSGNINTISARGAVGNVIVTGSIERVIANASGTVDHTDGHYDGIAGPVVALQDNGVRGNINIVDIGEGIAESGMGDVSYGGLYAEGVISDVSNDGLGSDVNGTIVGELGVENVSLHNGSIINAFVGTDDIEGTRPFAVGASATGSTVGRIRITGSGGIIGSRISAFNIGNVSVGGFGFFNSIFNFAVGANSTAGNLTVDGYGLQDLTITGGASMGDITATGRGAQASALVYPYTVRYSETDNYDPLFGRWLTGLNDIHRFLGTSIATPNSTEGMISGVTAAGSQNLGMVRAYRIASSDFNFANRIDGFQTYALVAPDTAGMNTVNITTGEMGTFKPSGDVIDLTLTIAGEIGSLVIGDDLLGTSTITALGPNGNIKSVTIGGNMIGTISATGTIGKITIGGDMSGTIIADATGGGSLALSKLTVGGSFTGTLTLNGNVGTIDIGDNFGDPLVVGASLLINGDLKKLSVGTDTAVNGSILALNLNVLGNLGTLQVTGRVDGEIYVGGNASKMIVQADAVTTGTSLINGNVVVMEDLKSASISNGDFGNGVMVLTFTVGGDIKKFSITNGDLSANATITSAFGDIGKFSITGGDLLGTLTAPNGIIKSLTIKGSDLGANSVIQADTISKMYIDGSILAGAMVTVDKSLDKLSVGQHILGDMNIGSSKSIVIKGNLQGNLTLGYNSRGTKLTVGGNVGDAAAVNPGDVVVSIDAKATVSIGGNLLAGTFLHIGRDAKSLKVGGTIAGDVFIDGAASKISAAAMTNSVFTTGLDIKSFAIAGNMFQSLLQTGIRRGGDGDFAAVDTDGSGAGRMGKLSKFTVRGATTNSIIASGGDLGSATFTGGMTRSSVSSGLVLGGPAIAGVINDGGGFAARLSDAARRNTARSDANRELFRGDAKSVKVGGAGMVGSSVSVGVDPGADGMFGTGDDSVASSLTGGDSRLSSVSAVMDGASNVVVDNGIGRNSTTGGAVNANVTYALADITAANPLEPLVGTAVSGTPVTINGVTVTVSGPGQVDLHNAGGGSDVDSLVISGTTSRTKIVITGPATTVGRILTADDAQVSSISYDGTLAGDGSADADLWLDSPTKTITLATVGDAVGGGRVGGDVATMSIATLGSGDMRIGGKVKTMNIGASTGDPLLTSLGLSPETDVNQMATDSAGNTWIFDNVTNQLTQVNVATGAIVSGPFTVNQSFSGYAAANLTLTGMDFDGGDVLHGVASLYNQSPTVKVGSMSNASLSLRGLTVDANGRVLAIETADLVALNGDLGADFDIQAVTVTDAGLLYAVNNNAGVFELGTIDRDVDGNVTGFTVVGNIVDDVAAAISDINAMDIDANGDLLVIGSTVASGGDMLLYGISATGVASAAGVNLTDGGNVSDTIKAVTYLPDAATLYVVRDVAGVDTLYTVDTTTGAMTEVVGATLGTGAIEVGGAAVDVIGMDMDADENIRIIGTTGVAADNQTFRLNTTDPGLSWELDDPGDVSADATGYASDAAGAFYTVQDTAATDDIVLRTPGSDRIVSIDTATGARTTVGVIKDIYNNTYYNDVQAIAFDGSAATPTLYAIVGDRDGAGGAYSPADGAAIVQIEPTDDDSDGVLWATHPTNTYQPGVLLDDGAAITDSFAALALDAGGTIYAMRQGSGAFAGQDHLVTISIAAGTVGDTQAMAAGNRFQVSGNDTETTGMGFDAAGNLVTYNRDSGSSDAELLGLTVANLATPDQAEYITTEGTLSYNIDAFALGQTGADFLVYAYDTSNSAINFNDDMDYGQFFTNPGTVDTLGTINTATGVFTQLTGLAQGANGTTLSSQVVDMSFDPIGGTLFVVTADSRLAEYNGDSLMFYLDAIGDTLLAKVDEGGSVVQITTGNPHVNWQVGDYLGNDVGVDFDDWFGQITTRVSDTVFKVTLSKGAFADVDIADGVRLGNFLPAIAGITDADTGEALDVDAIEFDDISGDLIGLDARFNQLVTVDDFTPLLTGLRPATATARTENGAVDISNLNGMTYDPAAAAFYSFRDSDDTFVQFRGTTQAALGGVTAGSIDKLTITPPAGQSFNGRVVTTGNTVKSATVKGGFTGSLISGGDIKSFTQSGGDFGGRLLARGDIGKASMSGGNFTDGGSVETAGLLKGLSLSGASNLGGLVKAQEASSISVGGSGQDTAEMLIDGYTKKVSFGGNFAGKMSLGEVGSLGITGLTQATADIDINGNAKSIKLSGGTAAGASLVSQGYASSFAVGGVHSGMVAIRRGMKSGKMASLDAGLLAVGEKTTTLKVSGNTADSVVSFGTWVGADGLYNTADDVITGGGAKTASFSGNFLDSAVVAGVLPSEDTPSTGANNLPSDMQAYIGDASAADYMDINPAEHGGILGSSINRLTVSGRTVSGAGRSFVAVADSIDRASYAPGQELLSREYVDPIGAPEVVATEVLDDKNGRIVFSEQINTTSLIVSQDNDGDGAITAGGADVVGTVLFTAADGTIINDITLSYSTQTTAAGAVQGVMGFYKADGFDGQTLAVELSDVTALPGPVIYGSSLRSARMDLNSAATATILADTGSLPLPTGDVADTFAEAIAAPAWEITLNGSQSASNTLEAGDVDIYRFAANVYEFFSVSYSSNIAGLLGLFYQDTQGTAADTTDDTFELVARWEANDSNVPGPYTLFEAFELPASGDYFILVEPAQTITGGDNIYTLEMNRAESDSNLIAQIGALPTDEEIAYVSNEVGDNNNNLGANDPRQLVYLDFDGGTATKYDIGPVVVDAFDLNDIEAALDGEETRIIEGGTGVVGIVDNIMTIFGNIAPSYTNEIGGVAADLNIHRITTLAEWNAATPADGGIYFTTIDPSTWGLDPDVDFTTAFTGNADDSVFGGGLLGIASQIDVAGQSKADNAIVFAQNFNGLPVSGDDTSRLNQYSRAFANVIAHEIGHTFGLNHQPTSYAAGSWLLVADDPDNNPATADDSNQGTGLMAYSSDDDLITNLSEFGTADLGDSSYISTGQIDTQDLLLQWFA